MKQTLGILVVLLVSVAAEDYCSLNAECESGCCRENECQLQAMCQFSELSGVHCNTGSDCSTQCCVDNQCADQVSCASLSGWVVAIIVVAAAVFVACFLACCCGWFNKCSKSGSRGRGGHYYSSTNEYSPLHDHNDYSYHHNHQNDHHHDHHGGVHHDGGHHGGEGHDGGHDGGDDGGD